MQLRECMEYLLARRSEQLVVASAGASAQVWWELTHDLDQSFYLTASMGMGSAFAAGIALGVPVPVWVFVGDGSLHMNPGTLIVERDMNLPNLVNFLVNNGVYGATDDAVLPGGRRVDFAAVARSMGIERVYEVRTRAELERAYSEISGPGYTFVVLHVEPFAEKLPAARVEAVEGKFRFGRYVEKIAGIQIFRSPAPPES